MNAAGDLRYNTIARLLHWSIAMLVLANIATGLLHETLDGVISLMPVHKSFGLTVLLLSIVRIGWRVTWRKPPFPAGMARWERLAATTTQGLFYLLIVILPLTGWMISSAGKYPLTWFALFAWPKLPVAKGSLAASLAHEAHELLGFLMLGLVVLHVAAALRHHFVLRDGLLRRMA